MRALARWCLIAWNEPIGTPNWRRSLAYSAVRSSMRWASPHCWAATPIAAEAAVRLGGEHADHAHPGELFPQSRDPTAGIRPGGAHVRGRAFLLEQLPHCVAERELIVGEAESHVQRRGNPSTRSAITLRWISLV